MYTYYDSEPEERHVNKVVIFMASFVTFILILAVLIGVGLSRGNPLMFEEKVFATYSTNPSPTATCLEYNNGVISTMEIYYDFIDTCNWTVADEFTSTSLQEEVAILYFVKDTSVDRPFAFYDYPFMVDNHEVIRVRDRAWENPSGVWYLYMIRIPKDDIASGNIAFD
jgi:hypothetical protein